MTAADGDGGTEGIGRRLFRFAILADTHLTATDGVSPSPWATNAQANARARAAVVAVNRFAPAFTIHLGDMVHPVPAQAAYGAAADRAREIFAALDAPVHYVPGNHDIGDKPLDWMPAEPVSEAFAAAYEARFGADHGCFDHAGCRFVRLDAPLLNSGLPREEAQWRWLAETLAGAAGRRVFVFTHYPPFIAAPDEVEHYDNLGEPARGRLLALLAAHRVEACFGAHVHNFFYDRRDGTDFYVVPAVSAIRHDYAELFPVPPADAEFGRDDSAKLGFLLVDVHERGHVPHYLRSHGATGLETPGAFRAPATHARLRAPCPVGVDMRQDWTATLGIAPGGAVDEFTRKPARNDYLVAALWEAGIRNLRVPADDLLDPAARRRLAVLRETGTRFTLHAFGLPNEPFAALLAEHAHLLDMLELVLPTAHLAPSLGAIRGLAARIGLPVCLSPLRSSAEAEAAGATYTHFITHGFGSSDAAPLRALMARPGAAEAVAALSFRIGAEEEPGTRTAEIAGLAREHGIHALVHVALCDRNPAVRPAEATVTERVAATLFAAHLYREVCTVFLDTFADIDRGYFPRPGLVDRRANPRLAGRVFAALQGRLSALGPLRPADAPADTPAPVDRAAVTAAGLRIALLFPRDRPLRIGSGAAGHPSEILDLSTGLAETVRHGREGVVIAPRDVPLLVATPGDNG